MEKVSLNDNLSLSRLIYGMWRLSDDDNTSADRIASQN